MSFSETKKSAQKRYSRFSEQFYGRVSREVFWQVDEYTSDQINTQIFMEVDRTINSRFWPVCFKDKR